MQAILEQDTDAALDAVLRDNLARVFSERDAGLRLAAIARLWAEDAVMFEHDRVLVGWQALCDNVGAIQARLPAGLRFTPVGPAQVNHGMALLRWQAGTDGDAPVVSGTDIAAFKDRRIHRMHVYLDPR